MRAQGWGLEVTREIEVGDMVIEYAGELVRKDVSDLREKYYNSKARTARGRVGEEGVWLRESV